MQFKSNAQTFVKLHTKQKIFKFLIISISVISLSTAQTKPKPDIKKVIKEFGAGINLSHFEQTWKNADTLLANDVMGKIDQIHEMGFTTIRLPIAFEMFLEGGYNINPLLVEQLKKILIKTYNLQMKLILTYHYGKLTDQNVFNGADMDRVINTWKQIQVVFKNNAYEDLLFEIYNEPTISSTNWKFAANTIVNELRKEDNNRIYIVGGTDYNSLNELKYMGKLEDNHIIYTFHFYEPFIFTHQGATWTDNKTFLTQIPFPYKRRRMPKFPQSAAGTSVEKDYQKYSFEGTEKYIKERIKEVYEYCDQNDMPVICTETGVIISCERKYRENYLYFITKATRKKKIKTIIWDYDQQFAVIGNDDTSVFSALKKWIRKSK